MRMIAGAEAKVTAITMLKPLGPQIVQDHDEQHHHRERQQHIAEERDDLVPPAAEIAGDQAEQRADHIGDDGRGHAPDEHPLAAPDRAREHVAALEVGAEPEEHVVLLGERQGERRDRLVGIEQRQERRGDRHGHPEEHQA